MKAKISDRGKILLKSTSASAALIEAIINNSGSFSNGQAVKFNVSIKKRENKMSSNNDRAEIAVKKITAL